MSVLLPRCRKAIRWGRWCLALGTLILGLSGCKGWETHDEGFRHSDLSATARQARSNSEKDDKQTASDPRLSEKAKQISRDLE
jgi:hypothetical protein